MTVQDFLDIALDEQLVAIFDYDADEEDCDNELDGDGYVFVGWSDEIEDKVGTEKARKWLEAEIENWNYFTSKKYGETILCLDISTEA